ncbi:putative metal homeostasis protein [Ligilactobacillus sp. WILCCON 0076]|uniref:Metal homeostasis protein n=1 Tax=Ligilactobacillus ubinensis TaxID=2876789 RepID=A0A9X2FKX1_9LACO|nr:putative metal homeostasis protein [Ligilactobacillus ubinensis]MCP0887569.1 putative metal homeostasis protein [Ligilactobacillus ubinensis]
MEKMTLATAYRKLKSSNIKTKKRALKFIHQERRTKRK